MIDIFHALPDICVIIYLDDTLIYSEDMSQHHAHVEEILQRLPAHGLYAGAQKCEFHKDTIKYLGCVLSPDSLHMAKDKVQSIMDWPEPRKVKKCSIFPRLLQLLLPLHPWVFRDYCTPHAVNPQTCTLESQ